MRAMLFGPARARLKELRSVLSRRELGLFVLGHFTASTGFWMQRVAVGWLVWQMTGSAAWLGLVAFAELFPSLLTGAWGGSLADRVPALRLVRRTQTAMAAISAVLAGMTLAGLMTPHILLGVMVCIGALDGVNLPARMSIPARIAPPDLLAPTLALNAVAFNLSRFVGPAIAASLMVLISPGFIFVLSCLCYLGYVLCVRGVQGRIAPPAAVRRKDVVPYRAVLKGLWAAPLVVAAMGFQLTHGLWLRPANELFPAFATDIFGQGELALGVLNGSLGIGAILGALLLTGSRPPGSALRLVVVGTLVYALLLVVYSQSSVLWIAAVIVCAQGAAMGASNITAMALVQSATPRDRLGRVLSIYVLFFRGGPAAGAFLLGLTAEHAGLRAGALSFGVAGIMTVALILCYLYATRGIWRDQTTAEPDEI